MEGNGNNGYHSGYNYPIRGALEVDVKARKIQEAAERLNVSTTIAFSAFTSQFLIILLSF